MVEVLPVVLPIRTSDCRLWDGKEDRRFLKRENRVRGVKGASVSSDVLRGVSINRE